MATGSTYPCEVLTPDGSIARIVGEITYTSSTNQPAVSPNTLYVKQFAFSFNTASINAGITLYTPTVGDLIYDVGISVSTAFNGTTPKADVGTFEGGNVGLFGELANSGQVALGTVDDAVTDNASLVVPHVNSWLNDAVGSVGAAGTAAFKPPIMRVATATALLLVVSQTGQKSGTAIGGTTGAGTVYIVTATPA